MDEPFGSLDAQTRELMQQELLRIWHTRRKTVVFVTHQIDEAVYLSDRVMLMTKRPGRISEEVVVDLPRPRELGLKRHQRFHAIVDRLAEKLQREVMSADSA
jgi:NitT/TauT family transport system ATP-binding protein